MEGRRGVERWVRGVRIGRGSFGTVSLAMDKSTAQIFAVKSVSTRSGGGSALEALENEIEILRDLHCRHVVSYLGDDRTEEPPAGEFRNLHMEYVEGGSLADAAARGELDKRRIRSYTRSLLRALDYIHGRGIVHCDVKGRNVLLGPAGAKLADFGSAWRVDDGGGGGGWRGTPLWMAPEVARGEAPSPAADVWSLGCTVIEMATGRAPWWEDCAGRGAAEAALRIGFGHESPKLPAELSTEGRDFLGKCLRRDPDGRWTCKQLLQHPFVAGAATIDQSPRSVFDGIGAGFDDDEDENSEPGSSFGSENKVLSISTAKERIGKLACDADIDWESDRWEEVRGEPHLPREARGAEWEQEDEMRFEYSCINSNNYEGEGDCRRGGGASFSGGLSCAVSWSCCCRAGLCCRRGWGESCFYSSVTLFIVFAMKWLFSLVVCLRRGACVWIWVDKLAPTAFTR